MKQRKNIIVKLSIILVLAICCCFAGFLNPLIKSGLMKGFNIVSNKNSLLVHFIYVGQGDAMAINFPNGDVMLIDSGVQANTSSYIKYLKEKVLNNNKSDDIDYLVLTHSDADHVGGALKVLQTFDVENIYMPKTDKTTNVYTDLKDYIAVNDYTTIQAETDELLEVGGCELKFLSAGSYSNSNLDSYVIRLEYLNKSFLFTGDITSKVESDLVDKYGDELNVDVLKVAHHGSNTSSSQKFLEKVTPIYAVISCGVDNQYDFPHEEVLNNLSLFECNIHRTDLNGNVMFIAGDGLQKLTGNYTVTNLILDYRYLVLVVQVLLIVDIAVVVIKNVRQKKRRKD